MAHALIFVRFYICLYSRCFFSLLSFAFAVSNFSHLQWQWHINIILYLNHTFGIYLWLRYGMQVLQVFIVPLTASEKHLHFMIWRRWPRGIMFQCFTVCKGSTECILSKGIFPWKMGTVLRWLSNLETPKATNYIYYLLSNYKRPLLYILTMMFSFM